MSQRGTSGTPTEAISVKIPKAVRLGGLRALEPSWIRVSQPRLFCRCEQERVPKLGSVLGRSAAFQALDPFHADGLDDVAQLLDALSKPSEFLGGDTIVLRVSRLHVGAL